VFALVNTRYGSEVRPGKEESEKGGSEFLWAKYAIDVGGQVEMAKTCDCLLRCRRLLRGGGEEGRGKADESEVQNLLPNLPPESLTLATMKFSKALLERKVKSLEA